MELFEILFIAMFILLPIMEQVLKRRRGSEEEPGPVDMEPPPGEIDAPSSDREPVQASEMVPDDLWAVLTGEQRPQRPEGGPVDEQDDEGWGAFEGFGDDARRDNARESAEAWSETGRDWSSEPDPEEAYSLERLDLEPVAYESEAFEPMERTVPSAEARHRAFHEKIDRTAPPKRRRRSTVGRALSRPETLRHAIILSDVLGSPKGLD